MMQRSTDHGEPATAETSTLVQVTSRTGGRKIVKSQNTRKSAENQSLLDMAAYSRREQTAAISADTLMWKGEFSQGPIPREELWATNDS